jgi:hypothetical protein
VSREGESSAQSMHEQNEPHASQQVEYGKIKVYDKNYTRRDLQGRAPSNSFGVCQGTSADLSYITGIEYKDWVISSSTAFYDVMENTIGMRAYDMSPTKNWRY